MQPSQHAKRRKKRILQGTKTVTVVRGKLGYGFTISGQNPCMLSCIVSGSPAELAGLKPGDLLYFVNGLNVSRAGHDDVVRMVGLSTGNLELQVAENVNSSDSSDDDYPPRSKSRYPNRVRPRSTLGERGSRHDKGGSLSRQLDKQESSREGVRHYVPQGAESDLSSSLTSQEDHQWFLNSDVVKPRTGPENVSKRRDMEDEQERYSNGYAYSAIHTGPVISTAKKISSASAVVKKLHPVKTSLKHSRQGNSDETSPESAQPIQTSRPQANVVPPYLTPRTETHATAIPEDSHEEEDEEDLPAVVDSFRAVVGYIGSIETPSSHTRPHQRLQALRNAVRRLRVEKRVHTLVLMKVNRVGVSLTNAMGKQLAFYPCDRIAFSGICPDDERFFGLVTLSTPDDDCSSYMGVGESSRIPNSSCHIFMIEPELSSHSTHVQQAEVFQIYCTTNPQTRRCDEFPRAATSLILCIANLYRDAPPRKFDNEIVQSQALADPTRQAECSHSSSNNSDSGLGFGKEEAPLEQNEQICVVDLPTGRHQQNSSGMSVVMDSSLLSVQQLSSPEIDVVNSTRGPPSAQRLMSAFDVRRGMNISTSSEEFWQQGPRPSNKLTPRAMPDPAHPTMARSKSSDNMWAHASSTENLRQSMQRLLQARQQQLQEQNCMLGSDGESHAGDPVLSLSVAEDGHAVLEAGNGGQVRPHEDVFVAPTHPAPVSIQQAAANSGRSAFQVPRPVSAPLGKHRFYSKPETVDMDTSGKLSPRAFPQASPSSSAFRSPSAPPAPFFPHRDSDEDDDEDDGDESEDDPYIRQILEQFSKDRRSALDEDSRRFSEGFALSKKREKEKHDVNNVQKWTKAGSFRRAQHAWLKQSFSQSHESLAVGEDQAAANHKLIAASSVNNIACQAGGQGYADKTGRVASWAVNFDNLLKDPVGIEIFREFLQKEFSEENIIFWKACEQYRQLADDQQRKAQAKDIYARYLSAKASDPVNVDSAARSYTEKFLDNPTAIMFDVAQQQIFQLMRQDSYARFLKSDEYKNKLMAEMEGRSLVAVAQTETQQTEEKTDRKKGKGKENNDKRRRSILPWKHNRKSVKSSSDQEAKKGGKKGKEEKDKECNNNNSSSSSSQQHPSEGNNSRGGIIAATTTTTTNNNNNGNLKKAPGPGIDLSTMRKEVFHPKEHRDAPESHFKFCRIVMPDGSTTVVCAKPGQTSRSVLSKLCEKRSISIASVDVFLLGSDRPLDLNEDISTLGSKEIVIERRVLFRLDLPNGKSIGVKAKPNRSIRDVFKPILNKYGYRMDNIAVHLVGSQECIDLDVAVSELDNQRAVIVSDIEMTDVTRQGAPVMPSRPARVPPTGRAKGANSGGGAGGGSLEEITNKIFEDLMRGKSQLAHGFDEMGVLELDKSKAPKGGEARSLGLFGLLRKESWGAKDHPKNSKLKGKVTFALPRNDSKKKGSLKEGEKLFEMLSSAQRLRLEEQRGVQISAGDLPSFLCLDKAEAEPEKSAVEEIHLDSGNSARTSGAGMFDDITEISKAGFLEKKTKKKETVNYPVTPGLSASTPRDAGKFNSQATPMSEKWKSHGDRNFSREGIIPSPRMAEAYFRMSPLIVDSRNNGLTQSLDESLIMHRDTVIPQLFQAPVSREHASGNSKPTSDVSSKFGSHAFRPPPRSVEEDNQAPVASPEKFSPESKKIRCSPDIRNSVSVSAVLPNKISPTGRSSSASSNLSSGNTYRESPTPRSPPTTSPQPLPSSPTKNINRMSDGMLLHKLQQAKRDREGAFSAPQTGLANNVGHANHSKHPTQHNNMNNQPISPVTTPNHINFDITKQQDLAQRALLSPRFDPSPQGKAMSPDLVSSHHPDMTHRALLSPRFGTSPRPVDPPPYTRRDSPFVSAISDITHNKVAPPPYSSHPATSVNKSTVLSPGRQVTLPTNQVPMTSPRNSHQTLGWGQGQSSSHKLSPYDNMKSPRYAKDYQRADIEQETVTFV